MKFFGKIVTIFLLFIGQSLFSQETYPIASFNEDGCVQLDTSIPVEEFYTIDISSFGFVTFGEAHKLFGSMSNNLLTYKVYIEDQITILQVHLDRTEVPQDLEWWNAYLVSICSGD
ncbi:MAG: hypothetical protein SLAVMIC_00978 [uncultured marine phage]|uniref:Uncharacterized protein n=1 Tax=uncultured marine phage TaxID=707152 RepID=A0A8D9CCG4_9VIRU|nr:MAG: hypothetical protein SLAVMIC_00978 [uncultured marine phage]